MPRLGGGPMKQSYLLGGQTITQNAVTRTDSSSSSDSKKLVLPVNSPPPASASKQLKAPVRRSISYKASESGSHILLPTSRAYSDLSTRSAPPSPVEGMSTSSSTHGIRRRSTNSQMASSASSSRDNSNGGSTNPSGNSTNFAPSSHLTFRAPSFTPGSTVTTLAPSGKWTLGHVIQIVVVLVVMLLVMDARLKVQEASSTLKQYKQEEMELMTQMTQLERHAAELKSQLKEIRSAQYTQTSPEGIAATKAKTREIENQISQLKSQHLEQTEQVTSLQSFLQNVARREIASRYGIGSVHVHFDVLLPGSSGHSRLTIELFGETPHAAWTFLQQIQNGDWQNSRFIYRPEHMVLATSGTVDQSASLEFIERTEHRSHQAWTVGLTPSADNQGTYNLYINLQDNDHSDRDVCLGKIVGGFDALQRLTSLPLDGDQHFHNPVALEHFSVATVKRSRTKHS